MPGVINEGGVLHRQNHGMDAHARDAADHMRGQNGLRINAVVVKEPIGRLERAGLLQRLRKRHLRILCQIASHEQQALLPALIAQLRPAKLLGYPMHILIRLGASFGSLGIHKSSRKLTSPSIVYNPTGINFSK